MKCEFHCEREIELIIDIEQGEESVRGMGMGTGEIRLGNEREYWKRQLERELESGFTVFLG